MILDAYLFGALPALFLSGRLSSFYLSEEEDLHMALRRKAGRFRGILGTIWDPGEGALAILIARSIGFGLPIVAMAGLMVVAGQMWPIFDRFGGEKCSSTGIAMAASLAPILLGVTIRTAPRLLSTLAYIEGWIAVNLTLDQESY